MSSLETQLALSLIPMSGSQVFRREKVLPRAGYQRYRWVGPEADSGQWVSVGSRNAPLFAWRAVEVRAGGRWGGLCGSFYRLKS